MRLKDKIAVFTGAVLMVIGNHLGKHWLTLVDLEGILSPKDKG